MSGNDANEKVPFGTKMSPIIGSLVGEADPLAYVMYDTNSEAARKLKELLTPEEAAFWELDWQKVAEAFSRLQAVTAKLFEKIPLINTQIKEFNEKQEEKQIRFRESRLEADGKISKLKEKRGLVQKEADKAELDYRPQSVTLKDKLEALQVIDKAKKSLTLIKTDAPSPVIDYVIWIIRSVLGVALGLSLGLVIGALNQYRPFSPILAIFWVVSTTILFNSGTVVHWLAQKTAEVFEGRRFPGALTPLGNKWLWILVVTMAVFSTIDAATLMFGAFRLLSVSSKTVPIPILLMVCFIFILPYLYMETRYGWAEGERRIRDLAGEVLKDSESQVESFTPEQIAEEKAEAEKLLVVWEQAKEKVTAIDTEISAIDSSVKMPSFWPPVRFGPGVYTSDSQEADPTWLSELFAPPLNEELAIARRELAEAQKEAKSREDSLREQVLARCHTKEKPSKGFFSRWLSKP